MTERKLRKLDASDRGRIRALFLDVFSREPWLDDWSDPAQLDAYLDDLTGQGNSLALGFLEGDRLEAAALGSVRHWYEGTEYRIDEFFVAEEMQGRGIGSAFLEALERYLREAGIFRIFLQTDRGVPAFGFYKKNGFREQEGLVSFAKDLEVTE